MKSALVILFSILFNTNIMAETNPKKEITDEFSDKVKEVKMVEDHLEVHFNLHAAIYKVRKDNPKFEELKAKLEAKKGSRIKVTSIIPSMEIKEIKE